MKKIRVNDLLEYKDKEIGTKRVVYLDQSEDIAYISDLYGKSGLPKFQRISSLARDIEENRAKICKKDPYARFVSEEELSIKEKEIRDDAWKIIEEIVKPENEPLIFDKKKRYQIILKTVETYGVHKMTVYKYLYRFWQRGKVKNTLIPDYKNSGGKGKTRVAGAKKRGRKPKFIHSEHIGEGINVDESVRKIFRLAISKFYRDSKEISLKAAFKIMLKKYFAEDYKNIGGVRVPILIHASQRPTYEQFLYWYNKEKDIKEDISSRQGGSAYEMSSRPILGSSTHEVFGPASRFEIDATVADVYLISGYNPDWIIGRPIVYVVIDVFSRLIVGVYVGLEGPSWVGAMMTLANTVTNKKAFCLEYGISIKDAEWHCESLPNTLLADGGELAGEAVESLATNLNVRIETTSPYRGDLKGIVERNFLTIKERVKPFLPGQVKKADIKRGNDYRLDAKLNLYQFTQIIIYSILHHNKSRHKAYERDKEMIEQNVEPVPIKLWEWGIKNRSGKLRTYDEDIVRLNLLPKGYGKVTRSGILFEGMEYSCERSIREGWFRKGSPQYSEKLPIVYDFRNLNYIYLKSNNGRDYEKCHLLPTEDKYLNMHFHEIKNLKDQETYNNKRHLGDEQQDETEFFANVESIVAEAENTTQVFQNQQQSKSSKVSNIRSNRSSEKEKQRETEAFELGKENTIDESAKVIPFSLQKNNEVEKDDLAYPDELDLLRRIRKQKMKEMEDGKK